MVSDQSVNVNLFLIFWSLSQNHGHNLMVNTWWSRDNNHRKEIEALGTCDIFAFSLSS